MHSWQSRQTLALISSCWINLRRVPRSSNPVPVSAGRAMEILAFEILVYSPMSSFTMFAIRVACRLESSSLGLARSSVLSLSGANGVG